MQGKLASKARIMVRMPHTGSLRQERELGAFVRYCVHRIERDFGELEGWSVRILFTLGLGYSSMVSVDEGTLRIDANGSGQDGALAVWDAMCRIEQKLRERRSFALGTVVELTQPGD